MWDDIEPWDNETEAEEPPKQKNKKKHSSVSHIERTDKHVYRRAFSEMNLLNKMGLEMKDGHSYHFITGGDVDALSYLQLAMKFTGTIKHMLFSTWCMAGEDILAFDEWMTQGKILKLDAYCGEIFPNTYAKEYALLQSVFKKHDCGRICIFKNHSKIFAINGEKISVGIETSANINTNPRTENGCITVGYEMYEFYKEYFDGINSFVKD